MASPLEDNERFFRICRLLIDAGSNFLRQEFDKLIPPCDLPVLLQKEKNNLLRLPRGILTQKMFQKLYPTATKYGTSNDCDISLLMILFRHLCRLKAPSSSNNWSIMPVDSDRSLAADVLRLKIYRNTVFAHAETCRISKDEFDQVSKKVLEIFVRQGGLPWKQIAETMLNEALTESESAYADELREWHNYDADVKQIYQELDSKADRLLKVNEKQETMIEQVIDSTIRLDEQTDRVVENCEKVTEKMDLVNQNVDQVNQNIDQVNQNVYQIGEKVNQVDGKINQALRDKEEFVENIANIASYVTSQPISGMLVCNCSFCLLA